MIRSKNDEGALTQDNSFAIARMQLDRVAIACGSMRRPKHSTTEETAWTTLVDPATTRNTDPSATRELHDLLRRAEGEYREMPGLSLTVPQAARLWGLDSCTCAAVLTTLTDRQVLRRTTRYISSRVRRLVRDASRWPSRRGERPANRSSGRITGDSTFRRQEGVFDIVTTHPNAVARLYA
jgi:hypothetical protein